MSIYQRRSFSPFLYAVQHSLGLHVDFPIIFQGARRSFYQHGARDAQSVCIDLVFDRILGPSVLGHFMDLFFFSFFFLRSPPWSGNFTSVSPLNPRKILVCDIM